MESLTREEFARRMTDLLDEFHFSQGSKLEFVRLEQMDGQATGPQTIGIFMNFQVKEREESQISEEEAIQIVKDVETFFSPISAQDDVEQE